MSDDELGRTAYEEYLAVSRGRSLVTGDALPTWDDQVESIRHAWRRAARAVRLRVQESQGE